jgi:DNA-binding CsgD family transcriptional regulator
MGYERLNAKQVRALCDTINHLYGELDEAMPLEGIVDAMTRLTAATWFSADEVYPETGRIVHKVGRNLESYRELLEGVVQFGHENPVVAHLANEFAPALRISDFMSFKEFSRTGYYSEVLVKLTGYRDQAAVLTRLPHCLLGFTLNRETQFTEEEKMILELLQPHLERVLYRATEYLALPANPPLTPREREVLHWLAEGKRDEEISVILRMKPRTVHQHVRAILRKLDVETRTAAAAVAWRARLHGKAPTIGNEPPRHQDTKF